MLENIASSHRQSVGAFHAATHSQKNMVAVEKALETFISASNTTRIARVNNPASAILALLVLSRPGITQVANSGHAYTSGLIPAVDAATEDMAMMPQGYDAGSQIQTAGHHAAASGFCGVVRRNPLGAVVVIAGTALIGVGGAITYARKALTSDSSEVMGQPEALPQPEMQVSDTQSSAARTITNDCHILIGQFVSARSLTDTQLLQHDLSPIREGVNRIKNIQLDEMNPQEAEQASDCVGEWLRSSEVEPLIKRFEDIRTTVRDSRDLSIIASLSVLRKDALMDLLSAKLNTLRSISRDIYNLQVDLNRRILQAIG